MRTYVCTALCCVYVLFGLSTFAVAQGDKPATPLLTEDRLTSTTTPANAPAVSSAPAPTFAPVSNKNLSRELTDPLSIKIVMDYPDLGMPLVDSQVAQWAANVVDNFQENITKEAAAEDKTKYELLGKYTVSRPSAAAVSITYELWTYTGGAHGNLDIITLNYDAETGAVLDLEHMFTDVEQALELMSTYCYTVLSAELGADSSGDMLKSGTSPDNENFSTLTLLPTGIIIQFQPYQVAPWSAGPQKVSMSLDDLADARPLLDLWGRGPKTQ